MPDSLNRPPRLILASSSPYRRELLERLRVPFDVVVPAIDETPLAGETPAGRLRSEVGAWRARYDVFR